MDELFKGLDGRLRLSGKLADSIMMGIVNSAMESAHQKSCSDDNGDLVRLNEKTRFCELAILQLDWCLKFLQEETEDDITIIDSTCDRQKLLSDLLETRDRIHNRLRETELRIVEKDRELTDRMEIECKLRLALDVKDEDITSLNAALGLEREKHIRSKKSMNGICGVDEQLCKIKAKLEEGQHNLKSLMRRISTKSLDFDKMVMEFDDVIEENMYSSKSKDVNSKMILEGMQNLNLGTEFKDMATDMDVLKVKIDSSFRTMANYVSLFKTILDEHRWVMDAEREIVSIVNSGFLTDMQCKYGYFDDKVPVENKKLVTFMDDIATLRDELEKLGPEISHDVSKENRRINDGDDEAAMMDCNEDFTEQESPSCLSVAQKIKTHEFIIKKKSIELESVKVEKSREKGSSALKSLKSLDAVHDVIARVNLSVDSIMMDKTLGKSTYGKKQNDVQSVTSVSEQSHDISCCCDLMHLEHSKDVDRLSEEKEQLEYKCMILEEIYSVVLTDFVKKMNEHSKDVDRLSEEKEDLECNCMIFEDIYSIVLTDIVQKMNEHSKGVNRLGEEKEYLECKCMILEYVYSIVLTNFVRKMNNNSKDVTDPLSEEKMDLECKCMILEDVYSVVLTDIWRKMSEHLKDVDLLSEEKEDLECKCMILEYIHSVVLTYLVRDFNDEYLDREIEDQIRKEWYKSILLETVKVWDDEIKICNMEQEFKEETYHHVLKEVIKDFNSRMNAESVFGQHLFDLNNNEEEPNDVLLSLDKDSQHDQNISSVVDSIVVNKKQAKSLVTEHDQDMQTIEYQLILVPLAELSNKIANFDDITCKKMREHTARLEDINCRLPQLVDEAITIREQKTLYKTAFIRRCYDLQTAEREVDLLGDEVDLLYDLVEKVYHVLHHYSQNLLHRSEITDVIRLIRKQLLEREACLST